MNYGIGNVKGKGGGAIPTITIELSQMLSANEIQLTNEQFEIIANNSFISVALPTGQVWGFNRVQDDYGNYHLAMCVGSSTEISYTTGDIDSTTKIITISMGDFSGGGGSGTTLYQHNVYCRNTYSNSNFYLKIINNSNIAFTASSLKDYIETLGLTTFDKCFEASGKFTLNNVSYNVSAVYTTNNILYFIGYNSSGTQGIFDIPINSIDTFSDAFNELGTASINGGSQSYKHNIKISRTVNPKAEINLIIENDNSSSFTGTTLKTYIMNNFSAFYDNLRTTAGLMASGGVYVSSRIIVSNLVGNKDNNSIMARGFASTNQYDWVAIDLEDTNTQIVDDVITL